MKIIRRYREYEKPHKYMGRVYMDIESCRYVYALFGLHYLLRGLWWLEHLYSRHMNRPSLIDTKIKEAYDRGYDKGYEAAVTSRGYRDQ